MKKHVLLPLLVVIAILVTVGLYFVLHKKTTEVKTNTKLQSSVEQLKKDLSVVANPQFIKTDQLLTPELQKIQNDIISLLTASNSGETDYYSDIRLKAVGKRYVLVSQQVSDRSSLDEIIDSQTGKISFIPNGAGYISHCLAFEGGRGIVLYIGDKDMYTYTLDQESFVVIPGSKLIKGETYHSGESDYRLVVNETHIKNSITITVFDESTQVHNPNAAPEAMNIMNKELRKETLHF